MPQWLVTHPLDSRQVSALPHHPTSYPPDNEVANTITPAARPPLPDTMNGLPIHPYVPLWAAVFAVSLWGNGDHGERGGIGLKISPRGTHRYTA
jgi:hypothetical protein